MGRLLLGMWFALVVILVAGCKPKVPSKYIQPDVMEQILYDYHQVMGVAASQSTESSKREFNESVYREGVFRKYGITEADFDSSMVYYCRHTSQLHQIYERLSERFNKEAVALGASVSQANRYFTLSENGDTADIWRDRVALMLVPQAPYNRFQFSVPADTTFRPGDKMMLNFGSNFLFQDGVRDGVVMLCLRFQNDSVDQRVLHVSSTSHYSISLIDGGHLGIKEVFGFFYLSRGNSANSSESTVKVMFIDDIRLIRMREKPKPADSSDETSSDASSSSAAPTGSRPTSPRADTLRSSDVAAPPPSRP